MRAGGGKVGGAGEEGQGEVGQGEGSGSGSGEGRVPGLEAGTGIRKLTLPFQGVAPSVAGISVLLWRSCMALGGGEVGGKEGGGLGGG